MSIPAPESLEALFRSLDLTLTTRAAADEEGAWTCVLARPDGRSYEIESVTFFDVDPETGEEWPVEPSPSRVLSVLAGGEIDAQDPDGLRAAADSEAAARAFLGDDAYALLLALDESAEDQE
jgi:hypothetical protein